MEIIPIELFVNIINFDNFRSFIFTCWRLYAEVKIYIHRYLQNIYNTYSNIIIKSMKNGSGFEFIDLVETTSTTRYCKTMCKLINFSRWESSYEDKLEATCSNNCLFDYLYRSYEERWNTSCVREFMQKSNSDEKHPCKFVDKSVAEYICKYGLNEEDILSFGAILSSNSLANPHTKEILYLILHESKHIHINPKIIIKKHHLTKLSLDLITSSNCFALESKYKMVINSRRTIEL